MSQWTNTKWTGDGFGNAVSEDDDDEDSALMQDDHQIRACLMEMYTQMGGTEWREKRGWNTPLALGNWEGCTFDEDGQLIKFVMQNNNLTGKIPDCLGDFRFLEIFDVSNNYIEGAGGFDEEKATYCVPESVGNLVHMTDLCVQNNYLKGEIPPTLAKCKRLQILRLEINQITGTIPSQFGQLGHMRVLFLVDNKIHGAIPESLSQCKQLNYIWLNNNNMSGKVPERLASLRHLKCISLEGNNFVELREIEVYLKEKLGEELQVLI